MFEVQGKAKNFIIKLLFHNYVVTAVQTKYILDPIFSCKICVFFIYSLHTTPCFYSKAYGTINAEVVK